jgi:hypothetical protein
VNHAFLPVQSTFHVLSIYLRSMVRFAPSVYCGNSHYDHGVGGYFVPSKSFISEPLISAGTFGYLVMLHVYRLIPSVYGLFGSVRMVYIVSLIFELLIFTSVFAF